MTTLRGYRHTDETKRKMSEAMKGRHLSEEARRMISETVSRSWPKRKAEGKWLKHHTEEAKEKIRRRMRELWQMSAAKSDWEWSRAGKHRHLQGLQ